MTPLLVPGRLRSVDSEPALRCTSFPGTFSVTVVIATKCTIEGRFEKKILVRKEDDGVSCLTYKGYCEYEYM